MNININRMLGVCHTLEKSGKYSNVVLSLFQVMGCTPLMAAVKAGSVALVRAILQRGGNPNAVDRIRLHAAYIAAAKGFFKARQGFCKLGKYFEQYKRNSITTIIISGDVNVVG